MIASIGAVPSLLMPDGAEQPSYIASYCLYIPSLSKAELKYAHCGVNIILAIVSCSQKVPSMSVWLPP